MRITPAGDHGVLVTFETIDAMTLHARATAVRHLLGVMACIAGHSSLLVMGAADADTIAEAVRTADIDKPAGNRTHRVPVSFADAYALDLPELLERAAISRDEFLARLATVRFAARFLGFRAGFAYLDGWPAEWALPRRPTHRPRVAAGSFAVAATMAGFYPVDSTGGWNILGRTALPFWDPALEVPNRVAPGDVVVVEPSLDPVLATPPIAGSGRARTGVAVAEVITPGQLTFLVAPVDWRRIDAGLPPGGPFDDRSAALANRAAGNDGEAVVLECTLVGPILRFLSDARLAWFGADAEISIEGSPISLQQAFAVRGGQRVAIERIRGGLRGYLAIAGGFEDRSGRFAESPWRLVRGEFLNGAGRVVNVPVVLSNAPAEDVQTVMAVAGPHLQSLPDRIDGRVAAQINRTGIKVIPLEPLEGGAADLPSCGMQRGTVQLHPDGSLVVMGPDHPLTGGYPQPMTILTSELWKLGQWSPGDAVRIVVQKR